MPASLVAVYGDVPDFLNNANMQVETQTLIGGNTTLTSAAAQGATTLTVGSVTNFPTSGTFSAYILDGAQSEVVTASVSGAVLSVPTGTLAAHAVGVSISSAGSLGCLADSIITASRLVDIICMQGPDAAADLTLYATSRTETLFAPSQRAAIDRNATLMLRPYHFPVRSVASVSIQQGAMSPIALSLANLPNPLPYGMKRLDLPFLQPLNTIPFSYLGTSFNRAIASYVTLTYTGGPIPTADLAAVPWDIRQALRLIVADLLGIRQNNTGAAAVRIGDMNITTELRGGGPEGNTRLRAQAEKLLLPYRTPAGM